MMKSMIVVDDFLQDPVGHRHNALALDFPRPDALPNFAGRNSSAPLPVPNVDRAVSAIVSEAVVGEQQFGHGKCRLSLAADDATRRFYVHVDAGAYWAGVLYLNPPERCTGGTEFFRHRELGTDRAPIYEHEMKAVGASNYREAAEPVIAADSSNLDKWEHLLTVPMRFNRLILLRPWLWHAAGPSFGDDLESGRLVQLFFFLPGQPTG